MVVAALKDRLYVDPARRMLKSTDSRVRAWACTALAELEYREAFGEILELTHDPSSRVCNHARQAVQKMRGWSRPPHRFHFRAPQKELLVLISEDDKDWQLKLNLQLTRMNFLVQIASTEKDTFELAAKLHPWLIVTDNLKETDCLSGLNSTWDLCRNQELRDTLIFMVTADFLEPIFLWSGGDEYFHKPVGLEFDQVVRAYFQGK